MSLSPDWTMTGGTRVSHLPVPSHDRPSRHRLDEVLTLRPDVFPVLLHETFRQNGYQGCTGTTGRAAATDTDSRRPETQHTASTSGQRDGDPALLATRATRALFHPSDICGIASCSSSSSFRPSGDIGHRYRRPASTRATSASSHPSCPVGGPFRPKDDR